MRLFALPFVALACGGAIALGGLTACDRAPPSGDLGEWSASNHDSEKGVPKGNQAAKGDGGGTPALVEITWRQQCATCHGLGGKGDGPQGPMFKPTDLSREDFQGRVKDEDIAASITNGKGRMPKFELDPEVVRGLVGRVRSFRGR